MKESIRRFMRVGTILQVSYKGINTGTEDMEISLKKIISDPFFEVVELGRMPEKGMIKKAAAMIRCGHMDIAYGGQGRLLSADLSLNDLNEEGRRRAIDTIKEGIDEAIEIGAEDFQFLAGRYEEDKKEESLARLIESTKELCGYAASKGDIKLLCEVFDYDIAKKSLIGPVDTVKRYADTVSQAHDNFGLLVDSSHIPMLHESIEENILPVSRFIRHAHMGNTVIKNPSCAAYGDEHPRFGFPDSENDAEELAAYLRILLETGFLNENERPIVSFEVKPYKDEDSDIVLAGAKRTLELAWELV